MGGGVTHTTVTTEHKIDIEDVEQEMENRKDEWLEIVTDLIRIPSENPPGDTREIAEYYTNLLDERGVPYEVIAPQEEMPNVVAQFEGEAGDPDSAPHLGFNGHFDTFPRREENLWEHGPFSGIVKDGKIYGRGVSDMHGGFTASLAAFLYLFENRDAFAGQVTITAVSDEESGAKWGTQYIVDNYPEYRGDVVISGEPSSNGIIRFGERGSFKPEIRVRGRSAHTCSVPEGLSAIEVLMDFLTDVRTLPEQEDLIDVPEDVREVILNSTDQMDEAYGDGATERTLGIDVNAGVIEGGEKVNLVAETARAMVDIRLPIGTSTDEVFNRLTEIAESHPGEIHIQSEYPNDDEAHDFTRKDPTYSDIEHPIFRHLQKCAGQVRGREPGLCCALAGTDLAFYREYGVICPVYGPTPHNLGSQNEYITVDDFMEVVKTQAMASVQYLQDQTLRK